MTETRALQVVLQEDAKLSLEFEVRLGDVMSGAFGWDWQLEEWYEVDVGTGSQVFEFAFVPDRRTREERIADFETRVNAALNQALPEINRILAE